MNTYEVISLGTNTVKADMVSVEGGLLVFYVGSPAEIVAAYKEWTCFSKVTDEKA